MVERIEADFRAAGLDERRTVMLEYAAKLTRRPSEMVEEDLQALRQVGFQDADILAIVEV